MIFMKIFLDFLRYNEQSQSWEGTVDKVLNGH